MCSVRSKWVVRLKTLFSPKDLSAGFACEKKSLAKAETIDVGNILDCISVKNQPNPFQEVNTLKKKIRGNKVLSRPI